MINETAYVTREEFERRMRALEGEKTVTRHILTETRQNTGDLATIKAQLTHLGDMVLVNAALNNQGTRLKCADTGRAGDSHEARRHGSEARRHGCEARRRLDGNACACTA